MSQASQAIEAPKTFMQKMLDMVERVGNKVPHPAMIFRSLIGSWSCCPTFCYLLGTSVTYQVMNPETHKVEDATATVNSLLTGGRHPLHVRVGRPELHGLQRGRGDHRGHGGRRGGRGGGPGDALIRKLVNVAPAWALTYILVFVGILSSIAADAGYLVLIPLAAAAFISVGRHPLAGLAASFAGVAAVFAVNILIKPLDGILTEITNDAIHLRGSEHLHRPDGELLVLRGLGALLTVVVALDHR